MRMWIFEVWVRQVYPDEDVYGIDKRDEALRDLDYVMLHRLRLHVDRYDHVYDDMPALVDVTPDDPGYYLTTTG